MKVPGRIEMGAVVGGELHLLDRPALPVRQILRLQSFEELQHARQALLVVDILDRGMTSRRIGRHVVCSGTEMSFSRLAICVSLESFCCFLSTSRTLRRPDARPCSSDF